MPRMERHSRGPPAKPRTVNNICTAALIAAAGAGKNLVVEETGTGANPRRLAGTNPGHMHRGHDLWNISLKFLCESTQD
jgi:hypothetical protein